MGGQRSKCMWSDGCKRDRADGDAFFCAAHRLENEAAKASRHPVVASAPPVVTANPKDAVGSSKAPMSTVSAAVTGELGLAMLEGALKYGRHNYREAPIRASVYFDAVSRHMRSWWDEGEDIDPDSGLSHITKAIATLVVLRDSMITGKWDDDRPPPVPAGFFQELDGKAAKLVAKYPTPRAAVRANRA